MYMDTFSLFFPSKKKHIPKAKQFQATIEIDKQTIKIGYAGFLIANDKLSLLGWSIPLFKILLCRIYAV